MVRRRSAGAWLAGLLAVAVYLVMRGGLTGGAAPDFSLRGAYGGRVDLDSLRGRPALLVFWTPSCGICRHELPVVDRLHGNGVEIVGISVGDAQEARDFLGASRLRMNNAIDPDGETARKYRVGGVPKLVLIDAGGRIRRQATGYQSEATLRRWFKSAGAPL